MAERSEDIFGDEPIKILVQRAGNGRLQGEKLEEISQKLKGEGYNTCKDLRTKLIQDQSEATQILKKAGLGLAVIVRARRLLGDNYKEGGPPRSSRLSEAKINNGTRVEGKGATMRGQTPPPPTRPAPSRPPARETAAQRKFLKLRNTFLGGNLVDMGKYESNISSIQSISLCTDEAALEALLVTKNDVNKALSYVMKLLPYELRTNYYQSALYEAQKKYGASTFVDGASDVKSSSGDNRNNNVNSSSNDGGSDINSQSEEKKHPLRKNVHVDIDAPPINDVTSSSSATRYLTGYSRALFARICQNGKDDTDFKAFLKQAETSCTSTDSAGATLFGDLCKKYVGSKRVFFQTSQRYELVHDVHLLSSYPATSSSSNKSGASSSVGVVRKGSAVVVARVVGVSGPSPDPWALIYEPIRGWLPVSKLKLRKQQAKKRKNEKLPWSSASVCSLEYRDLREPFALLHILARSVEQSLGVFESANFCKKVKSMLDSFCELVVKAPILGVAALEDLVTLLRAVVGFASSKNSADGPSSSLSALSSGMQQGVINAINRCYAAAMLHVMPTTELERDSDVAWWLNSGLLAGGIHITADDDRQTKISSISIANSYGPVWASLAAYGDDRGEEEENKSSGSSPPPLSAPNSLEKEEDAFLRSLCAGETKNLLSTIKNIRMTNRVLNQLGGKPAEKAIWCMFAAMIKHTGEVASARKLNEKKMPRRSARALMNSPVDTLWNMALKAVTGVSRHLKSEALEEKEEGGEDGKAGKPYTAKWGTLDQFCERISKDCEFLISVVATRQWRHSRDMFDELSLENQYRSLLPESQISTLIPDDGFRSGSSSRSASPSGVSPSRRRQARPHRPSSSESASPSFFTPAKKKGGLARLRNAVQTVQRMRRMTRIKKKLGSLSLHIAYQIQSLVVGEKRREQRQKQHRSNENDQKSSKSHEEKERRGTVADKVHEALVISKIRGAARLIGVRAIHDTILLLLEHRPSLRCFTEKISALMIQREGKIENGGKAGSDVKPKAKPQESGYDDELFDELLASFEEEDDDDDEIDDDNGHIKRPLFLGHFLDGAECLVREIRDALGRHYYASASILIASALQQDSRKSKSDDATMLKCALRLVDMGDNLRLGDLPHLQSVVLHVLSSILPCSHLVAAVATTSTPNSGGGRATESNHIARFVPRETKLGAWSMFRRMFRYAFITAAAKVSTDGDQQKRMAVAQFQDTMFDRVVWQMQGMATAVGLCFEVVDGGGRRGARVVHKSPAWAGKLGRRFMDLTHVDMQWARCHPDIKNASSDSSSCCVMEVLLAITQFLGLLLGASTKVVASGGGKQRGAGSLLKHLCTMDFVDLAAALLSSPAWLKQQSIGMGAVLSDADMSQIYALSLVQTLTCKLLRNVLAMTKAPPRKTLLLGGSGSEHKGASSPSWSPYHTQEAIGSCLRGLWLRIGAYCSPPHPDGATFPPTEEQRRMFCFDQVLSSRRSGGMVDEAVALFRALLAPVSIKIVWEDAIHSSPRELDVYVGETVAALRKRLETMFPPDDDNDDDDNNNRLCLKLDGRVMKDGMTLHDYGVMQETLLRISRVSGDGEGQDGEASSCDEAKQQQEVGGGCRLWKDAVNDLIKEGVIDTLKPVLDALIGDTHRRVANLSHKLMTLYAGLAVLGGHTFSLREGAHVVVLRDVGEGEAAEEEEGEIVSVQEGRPLSKRSLFSQRPLSSMEIEFSYTVRLASNGKLLYAVEASQIKAVSPLEVDVKAIANKSALVESLAYALHQFCSLDEVTYNRLQTQPGNLLHVVTIWRRCTQALSKLLGTSDMVVHVTSANKGRLIPNLAALYNPSKNRAGTPSSNAKDKKAAKKSSADTTNSQADLELRLLALQKADLHLPMGGGRGTKIACSLRDSLATDMFSSPPQNQQQQQRQQQRQQPQATATKSACPVCTFEQPSSNLKCSICMSWMAESAVCPRCAKVYPLASMGAWAACTDCQIELKTLPPRQQQQPSSQPAMSSQERRTTTVPLAKEECFSEGEACFLSAMGLPEKWCRDALKHEDSSISGAIRRLLKDNLKYIESDFRLYLAYTQQGNDTSAVKSNPNALPTTLTLSAAEAKAPSTNPLHHILDSANDALAISQTQYEEKKKESSSYEDRKGGGGAAAEKTKKKNGRYFPSAGEMVRHHPSSGMYSQKQLKSQGWRSMIEMMVKVESGLINIYARTCMFSVLTNIPMDDIKAINEMARHRVFENFLRLYVKQLGRNSSVSFLDKDGGGGGGPRNDEMWVVFLSLIKKEIPRFCEKAASSNLMTADMSNHMWENFSLSAPISFQLVTTVLAELLKVLKTTVMERKKSSSPTPSPPSSRQSLSMKTVEWVLSVFFEVMKSERQVGQNSVQNQHQQHAKYRRQFYESLCPEQLLNVLVEIIIASSKGAGRSAAMQLLSLIINNSAGAVRRLGGNVAVRISVAKTKQLLRFMFEAHDKQEKAGGSSKCFSPFLQGLIELNVSIFTNLSVGDRERVSFEEKQRWFQDLCYTYEVMSAMANATETKVPENFLFEVVRKNQAFQQEVMNFLNLNNSFSAGCDVELVSLVNELYMKKEKAHAKPVESSEILLSPQQRIQYRDIESKNISLQQLKWRFAVLSLFNFKVKEVLRYLNLSLQPGESALTDAVRRCRGIIFWSSKEQLWQSAIKATQVNTGISSSVGNKGFTITIDNKKALALKSKKAYDKNSSVSVFGQLYQKLKNKPGKFWRLPPLTRAFKVQEKGFYSHDLGGPYRDLLTNITDELQSSDRILKLLMPCPNMKSNVGRNLDGRIPIPIRNLSAYDLRQKLKLYEFMGKMMGLSIRTWTYLSLCLTSVVWKPLVLDAVQPSDIEAISRGSFKIIEDIMKMEKSLLESKESREEQMKQFNKKFRSVKFCLVGSDGQTFMLKPDGDAKSVTWDTRTEYIELAMRAKLEEFSRQSNAILKGLATVVPYQCLSIFTWHELRDQVCGRVTIDLKLLKKRTVYHGYYKPNRNENKEVKVGPSAPHVKLFWDMVENKMNNKQRSELIFFTWGRTRLPANEDGFGATKFAIKTHGQSQERSKNPNDFFPVAHTCFFQLDLPEYTNADAMYKKFLYAMTNCKYIDGDETRHARELAGM